jgi:exonuclease SbcC
MLRSLTVRNFQRHKHLKIKFSPRVTSIVGPSDRGKSAILRALRWVVENKPSGDAFIRHGQKTVSVTLRTESHKITRSKGKKNLYLVDGKPLVSFGQAAPEEVTKAIRMGPLNFQFQHDAPFWFSDAPGQVSRNLNAIVDLSVMDTTLSNLATGVRQARDRIVVLKEEKDSAKERVVELRGAVAAKRDLKPLICAKDRLDSLKEKAHLLDKAVLRASEAKGRLGQPPPRIDALSVKEKALSKLSGRLSRLLSLVRQLETSKSRIRMHKKAYKEAHTQFHQQTKGRSCPTCGQKL